MRKKIIIAASVLAAVFGAVALVLYLVIQSIPRELVEYGASEEWGADSHAHLGAYMTSSDGFDAYALARLKSELTSAYTTDSIETGKVIYSASAEIPLSLKAVNTDRSTSCTATVYLEDFFRFHRIPLKEGAYPTDSVLETNAILIDEVAAWKLFGTGSGVVGMEILIGDQYYTVSGITKPLDGIYTDVYGESPRVYLRADSSYMWTRKTSFTVLDAMLPDPITNYAANLLGEKMKPYTETVRNMDERFSGAELDEIRDGAIKLITDSSDTEYPYFEKAMLILSLKAADVYAAMRVMLYIALFGVFVVLCAVYGPIVRFIGRLFKKLKF